MKTFHLIVLAVLASFASAYADIPAPKPVSITVTNLAAFPKFKFLYRTSDQKDLKPIADGRPFNVLSDATLLVQSGNEPAQQWEQIRYEWRGAKVSIKVESVKQDGKIITVTARKTSGDSVSGAKSASNLPRSLPLLALTGVAACGLVMLRRRQTVS